MKLQIVVLSECRNKIAPNATVELGFLTIEDTRFWQNLLKTILVEFLLK